MKRIEICLIVALAISIFAAVAGRVNGQQDDKRKIYKYDNPGVQQDDKPKVKFIKAQADAIPGEYIVRLADDVKREDIETVADELMAKYGGSIDIQNEMTKVTKQEDGSLKTEVDQPGGKAIYKVLKGFFALMTEEQAKALSEDPRVDRVSENRSIRLIGPILPGARFTPDINETGVKPHNNPKREPNPPDHN